MIIVTYGMSWPSGKAIHWMPSVSSSNPLLTAGTYASEPQWRVLDFCVFLSDLSELRRALNFPSLACNL